MIDTLRNKLAQYITQNADINSWESIRGHYGAYTYLAFLCMSANTMGTVSSLNDVIRLALSNGLETQQVLGTITEIAAADSFVNDILEIICPWNDYDVEQLYQEFLSIDFIVKDGMVTFENGKNSRDVLGSYYTQENFAEIITGKAMEDYINQNKKTDRIKIVDFSCGGSVFLQAALKICEKKNISADIYGYDVDPVAVLVSRAKLIGINKKNDANVRIVLGNPLLPPHHNCVEQFEKALSGRYYNRSMGVKSVDDVDIVLGNPPWEKVRFEEKKFLKHFLPDYDLGTKTERENILGSISEENTIYFESLINDYEECKHYFKESDCYKKSSCGEINTYALFTELSYNKLRPAGIVSLIVKSSMVKLPVYKNFFRDLTKNGELYELYMFSNRNKIFKIDSREEFCVVYLSRGTKRTLSVALDLDDYNEMSTCEKVIISYDDLCVINPETGMMPSIKNHKDLMFLIELCKQFSPFGEIYKDCRYGRLVHLTSHSKVIQKKPGEGLIPIYEGKFIELYTGKYATFKDMLEEDKYKNKASARTIEDPQGFEYPESRFYIERGAWENISKNFDKSYVLAWRSLSSATNRRTMLATVLPLMPTCQSIQLLQLSELRQMFHVLALFDSIVFDYIVRLKMVGLDLTQTMIKQIPVPRMEQYEEIITFKGIRATISSHILSRLRFLYRDDERVRDAFEKFDTYEIKKGRKEIIAEIDCLVGYLYGLSKERLVSIANTFSAFYTKKEVTAYFK